MRGVTIGDGAVIGANSVITKDVAPYSVVGGINRFIRWRFDKDIRERLLEMKWWNYPLEVVKDNIDILALEPTLPILDIFEKKLQDSKKILLMIANNIKRNSNLELYRIIVMLFIVSHHYLVNSGLLPIVENLTPPGNELSLKVCFFYLFGMWGKTGINCFVLITGYFMCKSQITLRKFLKLLLQIESYNILINAVFVLTGYKAFGLNVLYEMFWPIKGVADGFTSCFLLFYLCIPFLNALVHNLDRKRHLALIGLCLFIYTVLGTTLRIRVTMNYVTWFCILYFISSYIRMYGLEYGNLKIRWGWMSLISIVISAASVLVFSTMTETPGREFFLVADSNHIMAVTTSVCLFMYFKDLPIRNSRFINTVASCMFGVLLIHANSDTMRQWLWRDMLDNVGWFATDYAVVHALASVAGIFVVCIVIDFLRQRFVEEPLFKVLDKRLFVK